MSVYSEFFLSEGLRQTELGILSVHALLDFAQKLGPQLFELHTSTNTIDRSAIYQSSVSAYEAEKIIYFFENMSVDCLEQQVTLKELARDVFLVWERLSTALGNLQLYIAPDPFSRNMRRHWDRLIQEFSNEPKGQITDSLVARAREVMERLTASCEQGNFSSLSAQAVVLPLGDPYVETRMLEVVKGVFLLSGFESCLRWLASEEAAHNKQQYLYQLSSFVGGCVALSKRGLYHSLLLWKVGTLLLDFPPQATNVLMNDPFGAEVRRWWAPIGYGDLEFQLAYASFTIEAVLPPLQEFMNGA